jgi:hypothetical protein
VLQQASIEDWKEVSSPVYIALLPYEWKFFRDNHDIVFDEFDDTGLGICKIAPVKISGKLCGLESHPDGPDDARKIAIKVLSYEEEWDEILELFCALLEINKSELPWIQTELSPGQWELYRTDDNANEVIMHRFPSEDIANGARITYEKRGHKQLYMVREVEQTNI